MGQHCREARAAKLQALAGPAKDTPQEEAVVSKESVLDEAAAGQEKPAPLGRMSEKGVLALETDLGNKEAKAPGSEPPPVEPTASSSTTRLADPAAESRSEPVSERIGKCREAWPEQEVPPAESDDEADDEEAAAEPPPPPPPDVSGLVLS